MKKGITPIIAIIILLLITLALAGVAWSFFQGYLFAMTAGSFTIPSGGAYCTGGRITVTILNTGQANITDEDFIIHRIDGSDASLQDFEIVPGDAHIAIDNSGYSTGYHTIDLGTGSHVEHPKVYCP